MAKATIGGVTNLLRRLPFGRAVETVREGGRSLHGLANNSGITYAEVAPPIIESFKETRMRCWTGRHLARLHRLS